MRLLFVLNPFTARQFTSYIGLRLERGPLSPNRHSLWLWGCGPHWATAPSTAPPLRGALTPVPLAQREYHLPLPLAGYQPLCVSSQLSASALCSNANHFIPGCSLLIAIQLMAFLISVHLHSKHLLAVHQEQLLSSSTSRSLFTTRIGCCSTHVR